MSTLTERLDEMLALAQHTRMIRQSESKEVAALVEVATQADKVCGQNNVNCPGAMRLKRALTALESALEARE